jgi:acetylornithine deacetylase/succinyl-diaminopimelate desuccinylase-like protein
MDFKGGLRAFTVAASRIARARRPRKRDIILLAEADEEGGDYGTSWLAKNHWPRSTPASRSTRAAGSSRRRRARAR